MDYMFAKTPARGKYCSLLYNHVTEVSNVGCSVTFSYGPSFPSNGVAGLASTSLRQGWSETTCQ